MKCVRLVSILSDGIYRRKVEAYKRPVAAMLTQQCAETHRISEARRLRRTGIARRIDLPEGADL